MRLILNWRYHVKAVYVNKYLVRKCDYRLTGARDLFFTEHHRNERHKIL